MTSLALWTYSVCVVFYQPVFFRNSWVLNGIVSYKKSEQVQQADLFKCKTVMFIFQHIFNSHLSIYTIYQRKSINCCTKNCLCCYDHCIGHQNHGGRPLFLNKTFSTLSKLLTPNMYYWSSKTIVTIHWMHFWALVLSSFAQRKRMTEQNAVPCGMFSTVTSPYLMFIIDLTVSHCNKTNSWYSVINSLQNVYLRFFTFWK